MKFRDYLKEDSIDDILDKYGDDENDLNKTSTIIPNYDSSVPDIRDVSAVESKCSSVVDELKNRRNSKKDINKVVDNLLKKIKSLSIDTFFEFLNNVARCLRNPHVAVMQTRKNGSYILDKDFLGLRNILRDDRLNKKYKKYYDKDLDEHKLPKNIAYDLALNSELKYIECVKNDFDTAISLKFLPVTIICLDSLK